jgi:O-antigen biosynthesis protein
MASLVDLTPKRVYLALERRECGVKNIRSETTFQSVRRHLRNGYVILTERGVASLYGAAMREAAKLIDSPVGVFLAPTDIRREGPALIRAQGLRVAIGAVLRQIAAKYDPPLGRSANPVNANVEEQAIRYHYTYELTKPDGVAPARRPVNDMDFALEVPFAFQPSVAHHGPVAAIIHAYYTDELDGLLRRLEGAPVGVDLFISTDTLEKKAQIEEKTAGWRKGLVEIRVFPNRGRDIAPKVVGFRDVYERYEIFVALHVKKSPHGGSPLARWRDYLLDHLIGSPEIMASILCLFDRPEVGIVFPQHLFEIRGILNWGYDYEHARSLMRRLGCDIDKNLVLEFPSGSMFWGRSAAIRPLTEIGLSFEDFPQESAQVDGTIAHAIERILLMAAETRGFEWLKIARRELYPLPRTILLVTRPEDVADHRLKVFQPALIPVDDDVPPYARRLKEVRPITPYPSLNPRPRLNLMVPTVNPGQTFGGVATALKLFSEWSVLLGPDYDQRIIVTDADIEPQAYASFADFEARPFAASRDEAGKIIVDANGRQGGRLDLRAGDVFIATAWWTADIIARLEQVRARLFGGRRPYVYLIQDDEPYFYGWGSTFALAEETYRRAGDAIVVINAEELFATLTAKYSFSQAFCLPYELNPQISARLRPAPRERLMLIYGRPSVSRNAFEIICAALHIWQQRDPIRASRWSIAFLGEDFETPLLYPVQNAVVAGKVSLDSYADHLSRATLGVSLMLSPHPSYPPLEMAEAGLTVIANNFGVKALEKRFPGIRLLESVAPDAIAREIENAAAASEPLIGTIVARRHALPVEFPADRLADAGRIAALLREAMRPVG